MNRRHTVLFIVGCLFLTVMAIIGVTKCAHENNQANMLWPEGRVITK